VVPATVEAFKAKLAAISFHSFFLPVIGLGSFSKHSQPHILWIGVGKAHPHLFQLHKRVNEAALACHLPIDQRAWRPHFTIARGRGISAALVNSFLKKHHDFDSGMFRVEEFHLYESMLTPSGPIHRRELTVKSFDPR
jgi:2'-5' RNA ligase